MQGNLSIERMCQLAGVSRAGFYRSLQDQPRRRRHGTAVGDSEIARNIERRMATGGLPRVAAARLGGQPQTRFADDAGGQPAGRAAAGVCGHHGLRHDLEVYPIWRRKKLPAINQLWIADITYIRLQH